MRTILLALPLGLAATFAAATFAQAETFLDGAYGDKSGCIYAKTGDSSGDDDFFLLNDQGITTALATCDFHGSATKTDTGFTVRAECEADGEEGSDDIATLTKSAKGYTVTLADGTKWGPYPKCQ